MEKLVSVLLISYNNLQYFKTCLDSILSQEYPKIEIIFSDDCSEDFNEEEIRNYIEKNKKNNLVDYTINSNKVNSGIVKNLNTAIRLASGDIIVHIACDDALFDNNVLNSIVDFYNNTSYMIAVGKLAYYDGNLQKSIGHTPLAANIPYINGDPMKCYKKLCVTGSFFPSPGLSYKRELIENYGLYDEDYRLVDDFSRFLYLSRNGCRIGYIDKFLTKYRMSGITSSKNTDVKIKEIIKNDMELVAKKEIIPFKNMDKNNLEIKNNLDTFISLSCKFYQKTIINGDGFVKIGEGSTFGYYVSPHYHGFHILLQARYKNSRIKIGKNNNFTNDITILAVNKVIIGDNCIIGDRVNIVDCDFHEINPYTRRNSYGKVSLVCIGNNVWIGSGVTILKGVTIGDNCVIGANSVVTHSIKENSVACGNPAKIIKSVLDDKS